MSMLRVSNNVEDEYDMASAMHAFLELKDHPGLTIRVHF